MWQRGPEVSHPLWKITCNRTKKSVVYNLITQRPPTIHVLFILLVSVTSLQQEEQKDQTHYLTRDEQHKDSKSGYMEGGSTLGAGEHSSHSLAHKLIHLADRNYFVA